MPLVRPPSTQRAGASPCSFSRLWPAPLVATSRPCGLQLPIAWPGGARWPCPCSRRTVHLRLHRRPSGPFEPRHRPDTSAVAAQASPVGWAWSSPRRQLPPACATCPPQTPKSQALHPDSSPLATQASPAGWAPPSPWQRPSPACATCRATCQPSASASGSSQVRWAWAAGIGARPYVVRHKASDVRCRPLAPASGFPQACGIGPRGQPAQAWCCQRQLLPPMCQPSAAASISSHAHVTGQGWSMALAHCAVPALHVSFHRLSGHSNVLNSSSPC